MCRRPFFNIRGCIAALLVLICSVSESSPGQADFSEERDSEDELEEQESSEDSEEETEANGKGAEGKKKCCICKEHKPVSEFACDGVNVSKCRKCKAVCDKERDYDPDPSLTEIKCLDCKSAVPVADVGHNRRNKTGYEIRCRHHHNASKRANAQKRKARKEVGKQVSFPGQPLASAGKRKGGGRSCHTTKIDRHTDTTTTPYHFTDYEVDDHDEDIDVNNENDNHQYLDHDSRGSRKAAVGRATGEDNNTTGQAAVAGISPPHFYSNPLMPSLLPWAFLRSLSPHTPSSSPPSLLVTPSPSIPRIFGLGTSFVEGVPPAALMEDTPPPPPASSTKIRLKRHRTAGPTVELAFLPCLPPSLPPLFRHLGNRGAQDVLGCDVHPFLSFQEEPFQGPESPRPLPLPRPPSPAPPTPFHPPLLCPLHSLSVACSCQMLREA